MYMYIAFKEIIQHLNKLLTVQFLSTVKLV